MIERILELMKSKGVTAAKLTSDLGLANSSITDWKNKKANPSYGAIVKIAKYFGVSEEYILGETDDFTRHDAAGSSVKDMSPDELLRLGIQGMGLYGDMEIDEDIIADIKDYAAFKAAQKKSKP